jgi:hypothetical protein
MMNDDYLYAHKPPALTNNIVRIIDKLKIFSTIYSDINSSLKQNKTTVLNSWILAFGNLGYISAAIYRFKQDPINTDVIQKYNSYK